MTRIIFIYGTIAGIIAITAMCLGIIFSGGNGSSMAVGYLIMLVALTMVFVGVKRHRDQNLGGVIKFLPAFLTGLAIVGVAGVFYVLGWEIYLAATDHAFIGDYAAAAIEKKRAAGVTGAEMESFAAEMEKMVKDYANPLFRLPMTFIEIFPVGLIVALISAALLRNPAVLPARAA